VHNVATLLQSRVPGLHIAEGSGSVGSAPRIRIRGVASMSLSNEPLVFIDGIRADGRRNQIYGVSGQEGSRLNDIAPEDIESIEVVKGPAAATLYGADASAGVINIITKRGRAEGGFTQTISAEYVTFKTDFESPENVAVCAAADLTTRPICSGLTAGTIVRDNPLVRLDPFRRGEGGNLSWNLRGGGQNYGVFLSAAGDQELGTVPNNEFRRLSVRSNFDFVPKQNWRLEGGFGLVEAKTRLPNSDNSVYGFVAAGLLGNALTVGTPADGLYSGAGLGGMRGRRNLDNTDRSMRFQPRVAAYFSPSTRFTHRLTLGADLTRTRASTFTPKNAESWYASDDANSGIVQQGRENFDRWTADYLGNLAVDISESLRTDLSWGFQTIINKRDLLQATGTGLVSNAARSIAAASLRTSTQSVEENRSNGVLGQVQLSHRDRLFFQLAGRLDRNSAFGAESQYFFSPRVGVSYVISDEAFWQNSLTNVISTLRLRAAYGTTGRSPTSGAEATYDLDPYILWGSGVTQPGVTPNDPGNTRLKPERGTELEAGFEAGLWDERVSLELTYFDKVTTDAILRRPIAPSLGFDTDPYVNIGKISNRGFEVAATARLLTRQDLGWEVRGTFNSVKNRVEDMGNVAPFGTTTRTREGAPVASFHTQRVKSVDVANGFAMVSDTFEFIGNTLPGWQGTLGSTVNFLRNFTLYGQFDFIGDIYRRNNSEDFRDRQFRNTELWVRQNELLTPEERLRLFGPFRNSRGETVAFGNVNEHYIEKAHYTRFRELSLTYRVPESVSSRLLRSREASLSVAGRNLATWTPYSGLDPETTYTESTEFFTIPAERRWLVRMSVRY
jgi:TonB-linked SusC/RagA family outer membrane protein